MSSVVTVDQLRLYLFGRNYYYYYFFDIWYDRKYFRFTRKISFKSYKIVFSFYFCKLLLLLLLLLFRVWVFLSWCIALDFLLARTFHCSLFSASCNCYCCSCRWFSVLVKHWKIFAVEIIFTDKRYR
jgi:hypothetical protein